MNQDKEIKCCEKCRPTTQLGCNFIERRKNKPICPCHSTPMQSKEEKKLISYEKAYDLVSKDLRDFKKDWDEYTEKEIMEKEENHGEDCKCPDCHLFYKTWTCGKCGLILENTVEKCPKCHHPEPKEESKEEKVFFDVMKVHREKWIKDLEKDFDVNKVTFTPKDNHDDSWEEIYDKNFPVKEFRDTGAWYACKEFIKRTLLSERTNRDKELIEKIKALESANDTADVVWRHDIINAITNK